MKMLEGARKDWTTLFGVVAYGDDVLDGRTEILGGVFRCLTGDVDADLMHDFDGERIHSLGVMPALNTSRRSFARWRRYPSAIWLRAELPVQRNRTFGFIVREHPTTSLGLATVEFDRSHGLGRDPLKFPSVGREISGGNGIRQL